MFRFFIAQFVKQGNGHRATGQNRYRAENLTKIIFTFYFVESNNLTNFV